MILDNFNYFKKNITIIEENQENAILNLDQIKKFLNVNSDRDNELIKKCFAYAISQAENILGICLGYKKYELLDGLKRFSKNLHIGPGPIIKIEQVVLIDKQQNINLSENNDYYFCPLNQIIIFNTNFSQNYIVKVIFWSKFDNTCINYQNICNKLLIHTNLLYKNRLNIYSEKQDLNVLIQRIYADLLVLLI